MKTFYKLALSGLSDADVDKVSRSLQSARLGQWSLVDGNDSDVMIIDVDSVWGHMDWLRAVSDGRRCAAYTKQESMRDCDLLLRKPLNAQSLIELLLQVQGTPAKADARPVPAGNARQAQAPEARRAPARDAAPKPAPQAAKPPAPTAPARPAPAPANAATTEPGPAADADGSAEDTDAPGTVGTLLLSGGVEVPSWVEDGDQGTRLFIDPVNHVYRAPPQLKPLGRLLELPASRLKPGSGEGPEAQHAGPEQPIVRLLWFAALSASDGQLAPHLSAGATWKLTRWPQIEREFPRHFRIATAMMKQAGTLEQLAEASKSPVEDVAGFINAYYVAGYVAAEGSDEPDDAANSTANVLSRLRRTFSRGTRPAAS